MSNVLKDITNGYRKVNKSFDKVSVIILILALGFMIIYSINNPKKNTLNTDISNFKFPITSTDKVLVLDTKPLQTATQLALINPDTEIFTTSLSKNDIPAITEPIFTNINDVSPCITDNEPILILKYKDEINKSGAYPKPVVPDITAFTNFYPAEDHHQNYFNENSSEPYCKYVIQPKVEKFEKIFKSKMKH